MIGYCARVSNPANQNNPDVQGLLKYCIKHKHWSIFEQACACFEITTTRAIAAQILRHRTFTFQEFSQRYAQATELDLPDLRRQDDKNRQNSIDDLPADLCTDFLHKIADHYNDSLDLYNEMLDAGVAKECARAVLPLNTQTRLYMTGTIRSWLHYCDLRCGNGTQKEHMEIASEIKTKLSQQLPVIARAMWGE